MAVLLKLINFSNCVRKKDNDKTFINRIYSFAPKKNYLTNKIVYIQIDEVRNIVQMDKSGYNISNIIGFRYIFVKVDNFSETTWGVPLKKKSGQTTADEFSKLPFTTNQKPNKIESGRGILYFCSSKLLETDQYIPLLF